MNTLALQGSLYELIPIKSFRARYDLPPTFGVAYFTPKDYVGLGSIDGPSAGLALNRLHASVLSRVPMQIAHADLPSVVTRLADYFRVEMDMANSAIGLQPQEVEFAVSGFADVTHKYAFALLRARLTREPAPDFKAIYESWLASGVRVLETPYPYAADGHDWQVRVISHVYGRVGLIVQTEADTHYLYDPALMCPAEGFMLGLLQDICARLATAVE
ncbi:MAG: hypothetical protein IT320_21220 [Anaerolineae bacterium]|nr:hypothetical protein [Anaerolineae bacterium]